MANKTREEIIASFRRFLDKKDLGEITVKEIVNDCGINRKTFYYHFTDLYALTYEVCQEEISEVVGHISPETGGWFQMVKVLSEFMADNRKTTLHIYRTIGYERWNEVLTGTCMKYIPNFLRFSSTDLKISDTDFDIIAQYFSLSIASIISKWVKEGMTELPDELLDRYSSIMKGTARKALENAAALSHTGK